MKVAAVSLSLLMVVVLSAGRALADTLYSDGPADGTTRGIFMCGPGCSVGNNQTISDGFVASASGNVAILDFTEWVPYTTTPTSITWSLGTTAFASNISSGSTPLVNSTFQFLNSDGYEVYNVEVTGLSGSLVAGQTYYLTLGGANDSGGTQMDAWDVNDGPATCSYTSGGVPQGPCGFGGETFTLSSNSTAATPEPGSLMLLGPSMLGFAGVLRRKFARSL
jgi:hypothetical protein